MNGKGDGVANIWGQDRVARSERACSASGLQHRVFEGVVSGDGEESRGGLKVTRTSGHGNCPSDAQLYISIHSTPYLSQAELQHLMVESSGSGVRVWTVWHFCH